MIAICHILLTELSYVPLSGKEIETVCSERAGNKSVKLALGHFHLFMWLLNKCLLMMSIKRLRIGRTVISLENFGQKILGHGSTQLNGFVQTPGGFHFI